MTATGTRTDRPPAATVVGALCILGVVGSGVMAVAHLGLEIPALELVGPGRLIVPAAVSFLLGTVLYAVAAYGALRAARWAWPAALVVNVLAFGTAAFPYRDWMSGAAIVVSLTAIAVLVSPQGRAALPGPRLR
jgi:hypothetical protein